MEVAPSCVAVIVTTACALLRSSACNFLPLARETLTILERADGQQADLCMVLEFGLLRSLIQNRLEGITQCEAGGWSTTHSGEHIRMCEFLPRLI